jgi:hypothetical protein
MYDHVQVGKNVGSMVEYRNNKAEYFQQTEEETGELSGHTIIEVRCA